MARINHVKRARASKRERRCRCGQVVQPGEAYKYINKKTGPRSGYMMYFCYRCTPRPSDTMSGRAAQMAQIEEDYYDAVGQAVEIDDLLSAGAATANDIEEFADEIAEAAENMESGFGHSTAQTEIMTETADEIREWAVTLREYAEGWNEEDCESYYEDEHCDPEDHWQQVADQLDEIMSDQPSLELQA